ncbi:MAG: hypothetical protein MI810_19265, partial [Flavobacteriales bacterium]|nr:hypothetical protein [Flavobacteriales bacterium]
MKHCITKKQLKASIDWLNSVKHKETLDNSYWSSLRRYVLVEGAGGFGVSTAAVATLGGASVLTGVAGLAAGVAGVSYYVSGESKKEYVTKDVDNPFEFDEAQINWLTRQSIPTLLDALHKTKEGNRSEYYKNAFLTMFFVQDLKNALKDPIKGPKDPQQLLRESVASLIYEQGGVESMTMEQLQDTTASTFVGKAQNNKMKYKMIIAETDQFFNSENNTNITKLRSELKDLNDDNVGEFIKGMDGTVAYNDGSKVLNGLHQLFDGMVLNDLQYEIKNYIVYDKLESFVKTKDITKEEEFTKLLNDVARQKLAESESGENITISDIERDNELTSQVAFANMIYDNMFPDKMRKKRPVNGDANKARNTDPEVLTIEDGSVSNPRVVPETQIFASDGTIILGDEVKAESQVGLDNPQLQEYTAAVSYMRYRVSATQLQFATEGKWAASWEKLKGLISTKNTFETSPDVTM